MSPKRPPTIEREYSNPGMRSSGRHRAVEPEPEPEPEPEEENPTPVAVADNPSGRVSLVLTDLIINAMGSRIGRKVISQLVSTVLTAGVSIVGTWGAVRAEYRSEIGALIVRMERIEKGHNDDDTKSRETQDARVQEIVARAVSAALAARVEQARADATSTASSRKTQIPVHKKPTGGE